MLTGAGFAQSLGGLSVSAIDNVVERLRTTAWKPMEPWNLMHSMAVDRLLHALRERYGTEYNFEVLLSALEDTLPFSDADQFHPSMSTLRSMAVLANWDPRIMRDVLEMVNHAILVAIEESLLQIDETRMAPSRTFFRSLVEAFRIVHSDLNYDEYSTFSYPPEIVDDGFRGNGWPQSFNPRDFHRSEARVLLMHLHGSALYRYRDGFVKVSEPGMRTLPTSVDRLDGLRYNAIISGTRKLEQFAVLPFLSYFQRFTNAILTTPRLLIIGYGGGDLHLNTYLSLFREVHRDDARVVWLTKNESLRDERVTARSLMALYAGYRYRADEDAFLSAMLPDAEGFARLNGLLVGMHGFGDILSGTDRIIRHLQGE